MAMRRYAVSGLAKQRKAGEFFYFYVLAKTRLDASMKAYREALKMYPGADIERLQVKAEA